MKQEENESQITLPYLKDLLRKGKKEELGKAWRQKGIENARSRVNDLHRNFGDIKTIEDFDNFVHSDASVFEGLDLDVFDGKAPLFIK